MQGIYKIVNKVNGKYYVGSTSYSNRRWSREYLPALRKGKHGTIHLQNAWNKYGEENFEFKFIEEIESEEDLYLIEQKYLDEGFENGVLYNIAREAGGGNLVSEYDVTQKHKDNVSKAKLGHEVTEETKIKLRKASIGWHETHENPNAQPYPAFFNVVTKEVIPAGSNLVRLCIEHNLPHGSMVNLKLENNTQTRDGWRLASKSSEKVRTSAKPYPAFYNVLTEEYIPAGWNLAKTSSERGLSYYAMSSLKNGYTQQSSVGWRLATYEEVLFQL